MEVRSDRGGAPATSGTTNTLRLIALLQLVTIVGLIVVYLQVGGVPEQTTNMVPVSANGVVSDMEVGPIASGVADLESQVLALQAKLDVICRAVESARPSGASATPCAAP